MPNPTGWRPVKVDVPRCGCGCLLSYPLHVRADQGWDDTGGCRVHLDCHGQPVESTQPSRWRDPDVEFGCFEWSHDTERWVRHGDPDDRGFRPRCVCDRLSL